MILHFEIDCVPQGRPRFINGHAIDPPKSRQFKRDLATLIRQHFKEKPLEGELSVELKIYRKCKHRATRKFGDLDNLVKGVLDAASGVLWHDDSQIVELKAAKFLDETPHIEMIMKECH